MELPKDLLNTLLKKIGEVLTKATEEIPEPTVKEQFGDLILNKPKEDVRYVYLKPKIESQAVLQQLEAIQKDKEQIEKQKEEMSIKEAQIADQHYSLQRAKQEIDGKREQENRRELQGVNLGSNE